MRVDKLTTKFQEALSDAQTLALSSDNPYIEPCHLLVAMLRQDDGPRALLLRAGVNLTALLKDAVMSPGGTTAAGYSALEENGVRNGCIKAIEAAYKRATEL